MGVLLAAPSAFAQAEEGVTLDPGSPTAREYALPIEQARRDASGGGERATTQAGAGDVPLFGEGVRPAPGTDTATSRKSKAKSKTTTKSETDTTVTPRERAQAQERIARSLTAATVSGGDSSEGSLVLLVGGSVVMTLGVALGYVLRRRRQSRDTPTAVR